MEEAKNETEARFTAFALALGNQPRVTHSLSGSTRFDRLALKVHDKIFAMVSASGHFVIKLPKARVDALVNSGAGEARAIWTQRLQFLAARLHDTAEAGRRRSTPQCASTCSRCVRVGLRGALVHGCPRRSVG